jgi:hypothetical protein
MFEGVDLKQLAFSGEGIFASLKELMASPLKS